MLTRILKTGKFVLDARRRLSKATLDRASVEWLKRELQLMGPTYIKAGQFISSRRDLFDATLVDAMRGLQDAVDPAPSVEINKRISSRLGKHMKRVARISSTPLACASIGQVHIADLTSGQRVVIKVRRPGVVEDLDADMTILMSIMSLLYMLNTENITETKELLHDFKEWCAGEMDYRKELENWRKLKAALKPSVVALPQLYEDLCCEDFLIMSYLPSTKISDAKRKMTMAQRKKLAIALMDCFVSQLVVHGVLHGDPHEGNLGVAADGGLVLYDMGNVISIDAQTRIRLKQMLFDIVVGNYDDAIELMRRISLFEVRDAARLRKLLEKYGEYIRTVDVKIIMQSTSADEMRGELPIKFSGTVFRIVRVFGLLEGICKDLDPEFSYEPIIGRYMQAFSGDTDYVNYRMASDVKKLARLVIQAFD